ncbi:MAG: antitoxin [Epulopiscium sp. Nele67-Bin004]|nr:MAG: antitoxin [Epulopiscium sp. Nele67-Bin004]
MVSRDLQIIIKIIKEIEVIELFIDNMDFERFVDDERTKRATCMTLINIGELVKNLTDEFRSKYNKIPWRAIAGLRDVTAHKYQTLKIEDIWITLIQDIPKTKKQLLQIKSNLE